MVTTNELAVQEWKEKQLHIEAQNYSERTPAEREMIEFFNRRRENLEDVEHRIEARFTPQVRTIDELIRRQLSEKQLSAINLMVQGICDVEIGRAVGVHRATVARWRLFHPAFAAELNRRRHAEIQHTADRLRKLAMISIEVLEKQLEDDSNPNLRFRAAITLLKMSGVEIAAKEKKPLSAESILDETALMLRKRQHAIIDAGEYEEALRLSAVQAETVDGGEEAVGKIKQSELSETSSVPLAPPRCGSNHDSPAEITAKKQATPSTTLFQQDNLRASPQPIIPNDENLMDNVRTNVTYKNQATRSTHATQATQATQATTSAMEFRQSDLTTSPQSSTSNDKKLMDNVRTNVIHKDQESKVARIDSVVKDRSDLASDQNHPSHQNQTSHQDHPSTQSASNGGDETHFTQPNLTRNPALKSTPLKPACSALKSSIDKTLASQRATGENAPLAPLNLSKTCDSGQWEGPARGGTIV